MASPIVQVVSQLLTTTYPQTIYLNQPPTAGNFLVATLGGDAYVTGFTVSATTYQVTLKQGATSFRKSPVSQINSGPSFNIGMAVYYIQSCSATQSLVLDLPATYVNNPLVAPTITVYELQGMASWTWPSEPSGMSNATSWPGEMTCKVINFSTSHTYTGWWTVAAGISATNVINGITGSSLTWQIDGPLQSTTTPFATTGSAQGTHGDIPNIDFGYSTGSYLVTAWSLPLATPTTAGLLNAVQLTDTPSFYIDTTSHMHFKLSYQKGSWNTGTGVFTANSSQPTSADYTVGLSDTYAQAWQGVISILNLQEGMSIGTSTTATSGLSHIVNAVGTYNLDPLFPLTDTNRVTAGTVFYH